MAKLLSTIIKTGLIGSLDYVSGALGSGWGIVKRFGRYILETDDLVVRGTMTVFELLIQKIRAIKGALGITQASGKIKEFREDANNYYIKIEDEMSFVANDIVKCQTFSGGKKNYWVVISAIQNNELVIPKTEFAGSSLPSTGDEIVQFGNTTDVKRQSAIYLHADENGEPAIDVLFGINTKSFDGCTKIRIGGAIPGEVGYKGFYCENGLIKSVNEAGEVMYLLRPDGSGFVAKEAIKWAKDGSGSIGGGAFAWRYDALDKKYVVEMGNNVLLRWENLSPESRENLKGLPGKNGTNGFSVFITYHDRETRPEKPTGNGTTNGWHTDATPDAIWMSQKITSSVLDGAWGEPIRLKGNTGPQGVPGTPGVDGKIYYTWIRFADDASGNGISNNPTGKVYMGLAYNKPTATESNNPLDYTWGRFRGEDGTNGVPGAPGIDGKTLYTWIAYSDNVDGNPMYQLPKATTRYIGISVNKETAIESSNPSDYTWSKFKGEDGDITSLPWLSDWNNNKTEIGGDHVVSPRMFSGTKNVDGTLTGVMFGREMLEVNGVKKTGVFGLNKGKITFMLDAETGDTYYGGEINVNGKFIVNADGSILATVGKIGDFSIGSGLTYENGDYYFKIDKDSLDVYGLIPAGKTSLVKIQGYSNDSSKIALECAGDETYSNYGVQGCDAFQCKGRGMISIPMMDPKHVRIATSANDVFFRGGYFPTVVICRFSANNAVTLITDGIKEGTIMYWINDNDFNVSLKQSDGITKIIDLTGKYHSACLMFYGGKWYRMSTNGTW